MTMALVLLVVVGASALNNYVFVCDLSVSN